MATAVLAGAGRAQDLARLLNAVAYPDSVAGGYEVANPHGGWRVHVDPSGVIDVWTVDGTAVLRGDLADPERVAALVKAATDPGASIVVDDGRRAELATAVAERYRPTPPGRW